MNLKEQNNTIFLWIQFRQWHFLLLAFLGWSGSVQGSVVDSLLEVLSNQLSQNQRFEAMTSHQSLGEFYYDEEDYPKSNEHFNAAFRLAQLLKEGGAERDQLFNLGKLYDAQDDYPMALDYFFKFLDKEKEVNDVESRLSCFDRIAAIYKTLGDYQQAYEFQLKGLTLVEESKDSVGIARFLHGIGTNFFYQDRYDQALDYYERSKVICESLGKEKGIYSCLEALGSVYMSLGDAAKSAELSRQSLALAYKMDYKRGIAYSLGNVASDQLEKQDYKSAKKSILTSIKLKKEMNDTWGLIGGTITLGKVYTALKDFKNARQTYETALDMSIAIDSRQRKLEIYEALAALYDRMMIPQKSCFFLKSYISLKDSMLNQKTIEEMGQSKSLYEVQKKEAEISLLKKENELLAKNETINSLRLILIMGVLFFLLIVSGLLYKNYRVQRNSSRLLGQKNELLESKHEEINLKNKQLADSNASLEQFAYIASHDLKEPLRTISSFTTLLKNKYSNQFDEQGHEFMNFITDAAHRMQTMMDDLLSYSKVGKSQIEKDLVKMDEIVLMVKSNLQHIINEQKAIVTLGNDPLPELKVYKGQMQQLVQNLINNAIKFKGNKNPEVTIDCKQYAEHYRFSIADNGIGIEPAAQDKIFEMFKRLHTRTEYEGTGIGLATCKKIVEIHGGNIWVESTKGEGSTFYFTIPYSES